MIANTRDKIGADLGSGRTSAALVVCSTLKKEKTATMATQGAVSVPAILEKVRIGIGIATDSTIEQMVE